MILFKYIRDQITDIHTVSLANDPRQQTTTQQFFLSPQALKTLTSPPSQMESPDHCNMLHMFNNNTYIDFGAASKCVLIPSYDIQVMKQNQNVTK